MQKITSKKNDNTIASNKFKNSSSTSGNSSKCKSTPKKSPKSLNPFGKQLLLRIRTVSRSAWKSKIRNSSELSKIPASTCTKTTQSWKTLSNSSSKVFFILKPDLLVTEKALNGFGDKSQLIEENEQKITKMKEVAGEIVEYVRERVYDKKHTQTQTMLSMIDNDRPFITTKELDEKRKMELKIKNFEKSLK